MRANWTDYILVGFLILGSTIDADPEVASCCHVFGYTPNLLLVDDAFGANTRIRKHRSGAADKPFFQMNVAIFNTSSAFVAYPSITSRFQIYR